VVEQIIKMDVLYWQWILIVASGLLFSFLSPLAKTTDFLKAINNSKTQMDWCLLFQISWILLGITCLCLGLEFGIVEVLHT
jgi:hypothetical protein